MYSHSSTQVSGAGVTTDPWGHGEDTGFWVLEFRCGSGVIKQVELRSAAGEAVASFGTIQEDGVFVTDLVTEAAGDYVLYFGKADSFSGEINVYFVPGIGYSVAD